MSCKDCQEKGHASKKYYKCKLYKEVSGDDVELSSGAKRKQSESVKQEKKAAKKQKNTARSSSVVCKNCKQVGHSTSRSRECKNHIRSKAEVFEQNFGSNCNAFTRKLPLKMVVNEEYQQLLQQKVISTSKDLRHIIFRSMCFSNYFCLFVGTGSVINVIFKQNYWYSICQLVNGRRITNSANIPNNLIQTWDTFRASFPDIVYNGKLLAGSSNCLSEACIEIATAYTKYVVENFETWLTRYLQH